MFLLFSLFLDILFLELWFTFQIEFVRFWHLHTILEKSSREHDGIGKHFLIIFNFPKTMNIFFNLLFCLEVRILMAIFYSVSYLLATHTLCVSKLFQFILFLHNIFFFIFFVFLLLMLLFLTTRLILPFLSAAPPDVF